MAERSTRVAVFIDWQNVYKAAREAFGLGQLPNERGNFSPFKLARVLAAGHGRGSAGELLRVEVHRGLPSSSRDPVGYGEMVARLKGPRRIETASWSSGKFAQRLREIPGVHHHRISGKVFALVEEPVNYAHRSV